MWSGTRAGFVTSWLALVCLGERYVRTSISMAKQVVPGVTVVNVSTPSSEEVSGSQDLNSSYH